MKRTFHIYLYSFVFFTFSLFAQETEPFNVIAPPSFDIAQEDLISVVVEVNSSLVDYFIITNDSNFTKITQVSSKRTHYCKTISLHLGENKIYIDGYKDGKLIKQIKQMVFFTSKVYKEYKYPPREYNHSFFHVDKKESLCVSCHDMSVNEVDSVAFEDITKSNCYQCHSKIAEKKHGHAPAVNWLCTSCHNGEVGKYNRYEKGESRFTVPDPIGDVCFKCHKKMKKTWEKKEFSHEPVESGRCNKCHSSHSSVNIDYLKKPTWDLCYSCHKIDGSHITKTLRGKIHPTKGVKDPSQPGKNLNCVSCHDPHVSDTASLLRSKSVFGLCIKCHKK